MVVMRALYVDIRQRARDIAARFPEPDFYRQHAREVAASWTLLEQDPVLVALRVYVSQRLDSDFGHGLDHALKVAVDAGALMLVEGRAAGYGADRLARRTVVCQAAALLHDICRKSPDHAAKGACFAAEVLVGFGFSAGEIADIRLAIESHEAFRPIRAAASVEANLVADCLYDADKFRWGPDNFRDTVWDMVAFHAPPLEVFLARYPAGLESLERIGQTFRSPTGRRFGPQFIRFGLAIGRELLAVIRRDFALRD
jgi:hypothetical protein